MELRFAVRPPDLADADAVLERHDHACRWCGFRAAVGQHAYAEEDGAGRVACDVCFNARHLLSFDRARFRLLWAPEIPQAEIAHLARVVAVNQMRILKIPDDLRSKLKPADLALAKLRDRAVAVHRELVGRSDALRDAFLEEMGAEVADRWADLDVGVRGGLLRGLRLLPTAFGGDEVAAWLNDDSSLSGYGHAVLDEHAWFVADIGLKPPPKPAAAGDGKDGAAILSALAALDFSDAAS